MIECQCGHRAPDERGLKIHQTKSKCEGYRIAHNIPPPPPPEDDDDDDFDDFDEFIEVEVNEEPVPTKPVKEKHKYPVVYTGEEEPAKKGKKKAKGKKTTADQLTRGKRRLALLMRTGARIENVLIGHTEVEITETDITSIYEDLKEMYPDAEWDEFLDPKFSLIVNLALIYGLPAFLHWDEIKKNYKKKKFFGKLKRLAGKIPLFGKHWRKREQNKGLKKTDESKKEETKSTG